MQTYTVIFKVCPSHFYPLINYKLKIFSRKYLNISYIFDLILFFLSLKGYLVIKEIFIFKIEILHFNYKILYMNERA